MSCAPPGCLLGRFALQREGGGGALLLWPRGLAPAMASPTDPLPHPSPQLKEATWAGPVPGQHGAEESLPSESWTFMLESVATSW